LSSDLIDLARDPVSVSIGVVRCACTVCVFGDESRIGNRATPASEAVGAGPIAAPATTPRASIAAASTAVTRSEGVWTGAWERCLGGVSSSSFSRGVLGAAGGVLGIDILIK